MSAVFSQDRRHRYLLGRKLSTSPLAVGWMLHNPSTAGESLDDPTSKRGITFTRGFGAGMMIFMNPWAGVATNKRDLWAMSDPVGPDNDCYIRMACAAIAASGGFVVAAWGCVAPPAHYREKAAQRLAEVKQTLSKIGCPLMALGLNDDGSPKHPLYLKGDTQLIPFGDL